MFQWLVDRIFPNPRTYGESICEVMLLSFRVKLAEAMQTGEDVSHGEVAMRALQTRPGWRRLDGGSFLLSDTGEIVAFDPATGTLMDLTRIVVRLEASHELDMKKGFTQKRRVAILQKTDRAVFEYFEAR